MVSRGIQKEEAATTVKLLNLSEGMKVKAKFKEEREKIYHSILISLLRDKNLSASMSVGEKALVECMHKEFFTNISKAADFVKENKFISGNALTL